AALLSIDGRIAKQCFFCYELRLHRARGYGALKAILEILGEDEGLTLTEISHRLQRTPGSTKDYLSWLEDVDLVAARQKRYSFTELTATSAEALRPAQLCGAGLSGPRFSRTPRLHRNGAFIVSRFADQTAPLDFIRRLLRRDHHRHSGRRQRIGLLQAGTTLRCHDHTSVAPGSATNLRNDSIWRSFYDSRGAPPPRADALAA